MRSDTVSLLVVVVVTLLLGLVALASGLNYWFPVEVPAGVETTGSQYRSLVGALVWLGALVGWLAYVGLTSVFVIPADRFLASFLFGTLRETYISGTASEHGTYTVPDPANPNARLPQGDRALLGDIVVLLWPFFRGVYFPTAAVKLVIHATTVYTREHAESPSIPVRFDVTILFRLRPHLRQFIQAIDDALNEPTNDLGRTEEVPDNLWDTDCLPGQHTYKAPVLAKVVLGAVVETVLQSVRAIASELYTWDEVPDPDIRDIKSAIPAFRQQIINDLAEHEDSTFCQAGLLLLRPEAPANPAAARANAQLGPSALSFDLRVEDIQPEDPAVVTALSRPQIEKLEAQAQRRKGVGEGDRLAEKAGRSGVAADEVWRGEVIRDVDQVNVYGAGDSITDLFRRFFGGRGRRP